MFTAQRSYDNGVEEISLREVAVCSELSLWQIVRQRFDRTSNQRLIDISFYLISPEVNA